MNPSINLNLFITEFSRLFPTLQQEPWKLTANISSVLMQQLTGLDDDYVVRNNIAIHKNVRIEEHVVIKGPAIISEGCFLAAHAYIRGGVFLGERVTIGPGGEVKSSFIFSGTTLAHFNFAGDSIIGSDVNLEAGAIIANHYNERKGKIIHIMMNGKPIPTDTDKFGALVGDNTKIGANAVLSPGTILSRGSIVKRLALIEQHTIYQA